MTGMVLAQIGFGAASMLLWAGAVVIPVVLHLWHRRNQNRVQWAAMHLLQQVLSQHARRVRIQQLLLLLVRMAVLIVLALILARPYWRAAGADQPESPIISTPRLWIIAFDTSSSMNQQVGGLSRFQAAQQEAVRLVQNASPGDAFVLLNWRADCLDVIGSPTYASQQVVRAINRMQVQDSGCDVVAGLTRCVSQVTQWRSQQGNAAECTVVILSDLGQNSWRPALSGIGAQRLDELATTSTLVIPAPAGSNRPLHNLAISSLQSVARRYEVGQTAEVNVQVGNYGVQAVADLPLRLVADGTLVDTQSVSLAAGQSQILRFALPLDRAGQMVLQAELPEDHLQVDNRRLRVINVMSKMRVLLVADNSADARLIQAAMSVSGRGGESPTIQVMNSNTTSETRLDEWDVVWLCDLPSPSDALHRRLHRYASDGGKLVCSFGQETNPELWNAAEQNRDLLGFRFSSVSDSANWRVDPLQYRSPVTKPFQGFADTGLLTTPVFRTWQIEAEPTVQIRHDIGLTTESEDHSLPLLVHRRLQQGYVACWLSHPVTGQQSIGPTTNNAAFAANPPWNAIGSWPSMVPLMQQTVQAATQADVQDWNRLAGQSISGWLPHQPEGGELSIEAELLQRPNQTFVRQLTQPSDLETRRVYWQFDDTYHAGLYRVDSAVDSITSAAVNVHPSEGKLQSIDYSQLNAYLNKGSVAEQRTAPKSTEDNQGMQSDPQSDTAVADKYAAASLAGAGMLPCWSLVLTLLVLLVCESCLGLLLGRRQA